MKQTIKNMHKDLATLLVMKLEGKNIKIFLCLASSGNIQAQNSRLSILCCAPVCRKQMYWLEWLNMVKRLLSDFSKVFTIGWSLVWQNDCIFI